MSKTKELYSEGRDLIPGGSLFSKRAELYAPGLWPEYYSSAKGIEITDLDGNIYQDFSTMGLGSCILGYSDPDVDDAVVKSLRKGVASSLNCPEEVELAKLLLLLHPWASRARFTRSGGEAMAVAVRIARAYTGRDNIAVCGYHGWHDWYLAGGGHLKGLTKKGVPQNLDGSTITFKYNDTRWISILDHYYSSHTPRPAAFVMEVTRDIPPDIEFLKAVRNLCTKHKIVLIFDEITSGFRVNCGGIHLTYGVEPDIAVFGKAIGNGYPIAAIIGNSVMDAAWNTFISSTSWTERTGFAAGIATIHKFLSVEADDHIYYVGARVKLNINIKSVGMMPLLHFQFDSIEQQTAYTQQMLKRGYLAGKQFYSSYAHTSEATNKFIEEANDVIWRLVDDSLDPTNIVLEGPVAQEGFHRLV